MMRLGFIIAGNFLGRFLRACVSKLDYLNSKLIVFFDHGAVQEEFQLFNLCLK